MQRISLFNSWQVLTESSQECELGLVALQGFVSALAAARRTTNLRLVAFHFFFDVVGELFDFFRFFQDVQGKHVFIRLVDLVLELLRQFQ